MPAGDGTGPLGMGPMTGRGAGYCAGYGVPGFINPLPRRGFGMGWGRGWRGGWGRGWRWRHQYYATGMPGWARFGYAPAWDVPPAAGFGPSTSSGQAPYPAPPTREQEAEALRAQAEWLKQQLDTISQRIAELEKE
jgi:hypothetical protein